MSLLDRVQKQQGPDANAPPDGAYVPQAGQSPRQSLAAATRSRTPSELQAERIKNRLQARLIEQSADDSGDEDREQRAAKITDALTAVIAEMALSNVQFESEDQLRRVIDRIVSTIGRRIDEGSPMVDARLKDGSRVNVIIPPLALNGPILTIRKFSKDPYKITDLIKFGTITDPMAQFVRACVRSRLNMLVSGGTGSGKTTTLNVLSSFIPEEERVVTVEDAAELQLNQEHVVTLESRPATVEGRGRIAIRDLVVNALRMRPDRIVVGECRGGEALDMLQAMNTGHDGSLTTIHANSPRDSLNRLETLVLMAGAELPSRAIREQISSAINVIVQQSRLRDGSRKIIAVSEVLGLHGDQVKVQDIFVFKQTGVSEDGKVQGYFTATGIIPKYFDHLQSSGEGVAKDLFTPVPDPAGQGGH